MQYRDMNEEERKKARFEIMRKIADYCEGTDCKECMFFNDNDDYDECMLGHVPADKDALERYINEQMRLP